MTFGAHKGCFTRKGEGQRLIVVDGEGGGADANEAHHLPLLAEADPVGDIGQSSWEPNRSAQRCSSIGPIR